MVLQPEDVNLNLIPDPWEPAFFNALVSATDDSDGDGHNNGQEYGSGTNPTNAASLFQMINTTRSGAGNISLIWSVEPARAYSVFSTTNLTAPTWNLESGPTSPCCGQPSLSWTDTNNTANPKKQYRVEVLAP